MTELPINQKEYLKKYLGIGKAPGEKKKKKKKTIKRVEIIDDDIEVNTVTTINEKDVVVIDEDAPQIVAIIDERPPSMRIDEKTKNPLWQPIGTVTNSEQSEQKQMIKSFKIEPKTNDKLISLSDKSPPRRKKRADVDQSPPRVPRTLSPSRDIVIKEERRSVARTEDNSLPRRSGDDDYSPPRRRKRQDDDISPPRKNRRKDEDISSPRKNRQKDDDMTPPRRSRDSTVDKSRSHATISLSHKSPPRRKTLSPLRDIVIKEERRSVPRSEDNFPPRRSGDDDISPPRKNRRKDDDISPPRKNRRKDDDMTPPRRSRDSTVDKSRSHATSNDNSPPRRESRKDLSPPRKSRSAVNRTHTPSPPRRRKDVDGDKNRSKHDDSPPRRSKDARNIPRRKEEGKSGRNRTPDQSPSRRIKREDRSKTEERNERSTIETKRTKKMEKTLDGKSAGLQNARELVEETNNFRSREDNLFKSLSKEVSGENATTVHRERQTGRIRNFEEELERQRKKHEEEQKNKEKYERWGRGLAQVESREQQLKEQLHEMSKPLARYADDEDLEKFLKEQEREGDPMLAYLRKKKKKKAAERGEVTKPEFQGEFMPNRYGIKPGHRWDGVDRSNGYEKKWFEVQNQKKAIQEDVYKWSTEDM